MSNALQCANFINGAYTPTIVSGVRGIVDPATGEAYSQAPDSGPDDVDRAVRAAAAAFTIWKHTTPSHRQGCLLEFAAALHQHEAELLEIECRNTGKPKAITREFEFGQLYDQIRFIAGAARCLEGRATDEYLTGYTSSTRREPVGVCGQITPWNYPLLMAMWKCVPALAAGNTVVLKPSELTPLTTLRFCEIASDFLPPGVLNVVCGSAEAGQYLVRHPTVSMVSLTGSRQAGEDVATAAGAGLKRTHLELGGKAPVIVFGDADLSQAAAGIADAGYFNAGQDCLAATRVLVQEKVHDEFVNMLSSEANKISVGDPDDAGSMCGPLISAAHRNRVTQYLDHVPAHNQIITGGTIPDGPGYFLLPTVITGVRHNDRIAHDELFGPVITVEKFSNEYEALEAANAVDYGLASSIWSEGHARVLRVAAELDFGCVWVNTHLPLAAEMPHGGFKKSGHGKDMSLYAVEDYTRIKHVMSAIYT